MPVLGITGGIATGKTTLTNALRSFLPAALFDADDYARHLVEKDPAVANEIVAQFGAELLRPAGDIDRSRLREVVFADPKKRQKLEAILHPRIRRSWWNEAIKFRSAKEWLFVDIPLLYETVAEEHFDAITVVACSDQTQLSRLSAKRKLTQSMAQQIIAAQLPLVHKMGRADFLIWNEGATDALQRQARYLSGYLINRYG